MTLREKYWTIQKPCWWFFATSLKISPPLGIIISVLWLKIKQIYCLFHVFSWFLQVFSQQIQPKKKGIFLSHSQILGEFFALRVFKGEKKNMENHQPSGPWGTAPSIRHLQEALLRLKGFFDPKSLCRTLVTDQEMSRNEFDTYEYFNMCDVLYDDNVNIYIYASAYMYIMIN